MLRALQEEAPMAEWSAIEQLMLELVNRARLDPLGEVARQGMASLNDGLTPGTITATPKAVLAPSLVLDDAARIHSQWMLDTDTFSHTGVAGSDAYARMISAGYAFTGSWTWGEIIAWKGTIGPIETTAYIRDLHDGLFESPHHRENIMAVGFREVGIGATTGDFSGFNALTVTQNFARSGSSLFVTGVAYDDTSKDAFWGR